MTLQRIMTEIKKNKPFADGEVSDEPRETLSGRLSRKRQAQHAMRTLTEEYRQELLRTAVFVLVTGETREQFVKTASEEMKFFSADADQFYSDIADQVSPQLYEGRESNPNVLDVVSRVLESKALEIGILAYPMITFRQEYRRVIQGRSEFIALVKQVLSSQMGTEVIGVQAAKSILNKAIDMGHDAKTTPILLSVSSESELNEVITGLRRLTRSIAVVRSDIEATTSTVRTALESVKSQLGRVALPEVTVAVLTQEMIEEATAISADRSLETTASTLTDFLTEQLETLNKPNKNRNKNKNKTN